MKTVTIQRKPMAWSYLRFSSPEQAKGDSSRRQDAAAIAWSKSTGVPIADAFKDEGISAFKSKNVLEGALGRFLALVEAGKIPRGDFLLIENLDRLSRQTETKAMHLLTGILVAGIKVVNLSSTPPKVYDENSNAGDLILSIIDLSRGHNESKHKEDRVGKAWLRKRHEDAQEHPITGRVPAWLRIEGVTRDGSGRPDFSNAKIVENRAAVTTIKYIVELAMLGLGVRAICQRLNLEGVAPIGPAKHWSRSTVRKITTSRALLGEYQPHKLTEEGRVPDCEPIPNYFPRILTEDQWHALQAGIERRKTHTHAGNPGDVCRNLFGKTLRHGPDNDTFNLSHKSEGRTLASNHLGLYGKTPLVTFTYTAFEAEFLRYVGELAVEDDGVAFPATDVLAGNISEIQKRIDKLADDLFGEDSDTIVGKVRERIRKLETERNELKSRLDAIRQKSSAPTVTEAHKEVTAVVERLSALAPTERTLEREKLRARIATLCASIKVWVAMDSAAFALVADIILSNGHHYILGVREQRHKRSVTSCCTTTAVPADWVATNFKPDMMARHWLKHGINNPHETMLITGGRATVLSYGDANSPAAAKMRQYTNR